MRTIYKGVILDDLTASQAVLTDGSKKLVSLDYLNQAVKTTSSPSFVTVTSTTLSTSNLNACSYENEAVFSDNAMVFA